MTVEGELGVLAGIEDEVQAAKHIYTQPDEVEDFVKKTGVDSPGDLDRHLARRRQVQARAVHPRRARRPIPPPLRFDILKEIEKRIPGFPIVLHGASSVLTEYVEIINKYGGKMKDAVGIPEEQLRQAARSAVCKINIDSDGRLVITAIVRKVLAENPGEFDPRKYLGPARDELTKMIARKNKDVLGSAGHAWD